VRALAYLAPFAAVRKTGQTASEGAETEGHWAR
jgi:hypothetical protein